MATEKIILGIDPGTTIMGFGLVCCKGNNIELITLDIIKLTHLDTHPLKLQSIFKKVLMLIDSYHPDEVALEAPFYGKNVQSMLKLGRAQGVAMAAALYRDIPIFEYSPRKIKQSITGNGNASKEQVSGMVNRIFTIAEQPKYLDATDAVAVALCHYYQNKSIESSSPAKKGSSWAAFIKDNPDRLK